jgi:hypothetical protein
MIELFKEGVRKYPITKFFLKVIAAEIVIVILQLLAPQWLYRWIP